MVCRVRILDINIYDLCFDDNLEVSLEIQTRESPLYGHIYYDIKNIIISNVDSKYNPFSEICNADLINGFVLYKSDNVDKIIDEIGKDKIITKYILHEMIKLSKQNNINYK